MGLILVGVKVLGRPPELMKEVVAVVKLLLVCSLLLPMVLLSMLLLPMSPLLMLLPLTSLLRLHPKKMGPKFVEVGKY